MDFVQILVDAADRLAAVSTQLVLVMAGVGGIALIILYLSGQAGRTRRGQRTDAAGSFVEVILLGCCLISLESLVNAGAHQFGFGAVTFDAIAYVPESRYGPAARAVNAGLTLLQTVGWAFIFNGLLRLRRAQKDGHTGLSRGDDIAKRLNFDYTIWTENKISVSQPLSLFLLFACAHLCSIGLRSGEYVGKYSTIYPASMMTC